ncbi:hypothetical protein EDF24_3294 [Curtobacterium sp. PhB130]|nr:hypothetical protein EDF24_3294 [Curtobacterium sp. PhB130]
MNPDAMTSTADPYVRYPREIAAAVTLPVAATALVAPGTDPPSPGARSAIGTACGALATRMALIRFLAAPTAGERAAGVRPFDPFRDPTPLALHGQGPSPDRDRIRIAGDRAVAVWHGWKAQGSPRDDRRGVAGALALGAWCSWALGSSARAAVRAQYALDTVPDDALAGLVQRSCAAGSAPSWQG